ncbi:hypothetical protein AN958_04183 [Leucoagaricus sp. SymC.cos]|nr:hypothetical protein AN958_04183 [Leucoagaricus sp. SymC.cos]
MICSRPEYHLQGTFSQADFEVHCRKEEMIIDTSDGRKDASRFIKEILKEIWLKYNVVPSQRAKGRLWPSKRKTKKLTKAMDGLFVVASTALAFIDDPRYGNPVARLDIYLNAMADAFSGRKIPSNRSIYCTVAFYPTFRRTCCPPP